jgi:sterol desaturase/sphingolipid hydroxylase (fatty acid hydroxylase superfamily)
MSNGRARALVPLLVGALGLGLLLALQHWFPARKPKRRVRDRLPSNAALVAATVLTSAATARPIARKLARIGEQRGHGIARRLPPPVRPVVAFLLLDASFWAWHRLNHEVPFLWRFHAVHHVDPDLDTATALRFHPGEILLSTLFRALQVRVVGPSPAVLEAYDAVFSAFVLYHHSNVQIPFERWFALVFTTPGTHAVHHYERFDQGNYGTVFSIWDRLAGTFEPLRPPEDLRIGARGYPETVDVGEALALPLHRPQP